MSAALRTTCRAGKGFSPGSGGRKTTEAETAGVSVPGFLPLWSHVSCLLTLQALPSPPPPNPVCSVSFRQISLIVNSVNIGPLSLSH